MKLALFDFDGTITSKNSDIDFIWYVADLKNFILGSIILSFFLVLYSIGIISNRKLKEKAFIMFFQNMDADFFKEKADSYAKKRMLGILRKKALDKIKWHKDQGHKVVVVTASIPDYVKIWCDSLGIDLIATDLEIVEKKMTGRLKGINCYGKNKVALIKERYNIEDYEYIYAYGNSIGDKPMLGLADEAHYKSL